MIELGWGGQLDEGFQKFQKFENNNEKHQNQINPEVVPINGTFIFLKFLIFFFVFLMIFLMNFFIEQVVETLDRRAVYSSSYYLAAKISENEF